VDANTRKIDDLLRQIQKLERENESLNKQKEDEENRLADILRQIEANNKRIK
jgi:predicted  nucleic acid-binding Zn-ribbon protein